MFDYGAVDSQNTYRTVNVCNHNISRGTVILNNTSLRNHRLGRIFRIVCVDQFRRYIIIIEGEICKLLLQFLTCLKSNFVLLLFPKFLYPCIAGFMKVMPPSPPFIPHYSQTLNHLYRVAELADWLIEHRCITKSLKQSLLSSSSYDRAEQLLTSIINQSVVTYNVFLEGLLVTDQQPLYLAVTAKGNIASNRL